MDKKDDIKGMGGMGAGPALILGMIAGWFMFVALVSFTINFIMPVAVSGGIVSVAVAAISAPVVIVYLLKKRKAEMNAERDREAQLVLDRGLNTFESKGYDDEAAKLAELYKD